MTQTPETLTASVENPENGLESATTQKQELEQLIQEFEQYRERLLSETVTTGQRAKVSKKKVMTNLEPELAKIDAALVTLRQQQSQL
ncbi:MAG: hypothetical protein AB4080_14610 [Trichodesmium sp.]